MRELPKGWIETKFQNVFQCIDGDRGSNYPKKHDFLIEGECLFLSTKNVRKNGFLWNDLVYISQEKHETLKNGTLKINDIVLTTRGTLGNVAWYSPQVPFPKVRINSGMLILRLSFESANFKYLTYFIKSPVFQRQVEENQTGSAQPQLPANILKEFDVGLAPLAEQKRIVEKLDEVLAQVDTIKARLDGIPAILKRFRQSVLASAVSGKLLKGVFGYQSTEVGDPWSHEVVAPEHWKLFEFKNAVKIIGGSQPPKSEFKSEPKEGLVRLIQIRDYKSEKYMVYIPIEKARRFCSENDIMIGRYGPPIFQILRGLSGAYNVALMKAEPAIEELDKEYLYRFLQNPKLFNYIDAGSDRTAGQAGVNKKFLESYPLFLPPIEEQKEIVRLVDNYFELADTIEAQVKKAQARVDNLTQSILAKAFRGELVPQDPNDEPADKLLERIAQARVEAEALSKAAKKGVGSKKTSAK